MNDWIIEKWSDFGIQALHLVKRHFKQAEFINNTCTIEKYAKWATREDGPGLWKVQSAENSSPQDRDYIVRQESFYYGFYVD